MCFSPCSCAKTKRQVCFPPALAAKLYRRRQPLDDLGRCLHVDVVERVIAETGSKGSGQITLSYIAHVSFLTRSGRSGCHLVSRACTSPPPPREPVERNGRVAFPRSGFVTGCEIDDSRHQVFGREAVSGSRAARSCRRRSRHVARSLGRGHCIDRGLWRYVLDRDERGWTST